MGQKGDQETLSSGRILIFKYFLIDFQKYLFGQNLVQFYV